MMSNANVNYSVINNNVNCHDLETLCNKFMLITKQNNNVGIKFYDVLNQN